MRWRFSLTKRVISNHSVSWINRKLAEILNPFIRNLVAKHMSPSKETVTIPYFPSCLINNNYIEQICWNERLRGGETMIKSCFDSLMGLIVKFKILHSLVFNGTLINFMVHDTKVQAGCFYLQWKFCLYVGPSFLRVMAGYKNI